jgi:Tfp pilus assembly protein PilF
MDDDIATDAIFYFEAGNNHLTEKAWAQAEVCYRQALTLQNNLAEVYANLAFVLEAQNRKGEAQLAYAQAFKLQADNTQITLNYAGLLSETKQFNTAESLYLQILSVEDNPQAWSSLGVLYARTHNTSAAMECYARAIALAPDYANPKFNRSYLQLLHGNLIDGWQDFEHRSSYNMLTSQMTCPRWQGESLAGKSIFVGCEAGYGDTLQFCRYLPMLKQQGAAQVTLLCYPTLKPLFSSLAGIDHLYAMGEDIPNLDWAYWTPLLSLPHIFKTDLETIPNNIPYLSVSAEKKQSWAKRLATTKPRIGLVWQGSQRHENDTDRSISVIKLLEPLLNRTEVHWISLQKPLTQQDHVQMTTWNIQHLGDDIIDFSDTAAIISQLDLLITVDTAVAHVAGALGVRCWLMLPAYQVDWRWLLARQDSPWYPSLRLFRQSQAGLWSDVVEAIAFELNKFLSTQTKVITHLPLVD